MKGWRISSWIFLLVGALNPSTLELRFQGRGRRCWLINFVHFARGVGVEFPIGPFGIQQIKRILGGLLAGVSFSVTLWFGIFLVYFDRVFILSLF